MPTINVHYSLSAVAAATFVVVSGEDNIFILELLQLPRIHSTFGSSVYSEDQQI